MFQHVLRGRTCAVAGVCFVACLLGDATSCRSADATPVTALYKIAFGKGNSATFTHVVDLKSGVAYAIPVAVESGGEHSLLESLLIKNAAGDVVQTYSFHLSQEELAPRVMEDFPDVFQEDDFNMVAFERLLTGSQITVAVPQQRFAIDVAAALNRADPDEPTMTASLRTDREGLVELTGELLGFTENGGKLKLLVGDGEESKIVEIAKESVHSVQFGGDVLRNLQHAAEHQRQLGSGIQQLIIEPTENIPNAFISYVAESGEAVEIDAVGELDDDDRAMSISGWIKLRNATPFAWRDTDITVITADEGDANYALGKVSLERGNVKRVSLSQPADRAWVLSVKHRLVVDEPTDGPNPKLPVHLFMELENPSSLALVADRLLVRRGSKVVTAVADRIELGSRSSSKKDVDLGPSKAIEVEADRASDVPVAIDSLADPIGYTLRCRAGRFTAYRFSYVGANKDSKLPVELQFQRSSSHSLLEVPSRFSRVDGVLRLVEPVNYMEVIEYQVPEEIIPLPIASTDPGISPGGLMWLAQYSDRGDLLPALSKIANIRAAQQRVGDELEALELEHSTLLSRQEDYYSQPQSAIHDVITRGLNDAIYDLQLEIGEKRRELAEQDYRLDSVVRELF